MMAIERGSQVEMPNRPTNISLMNRRWPEVTDRYEVVNRLIWLTALVADGTRIGRSPSHSENHSDVVFKSVVRHATDHDLPWFRFTCSLSEAALTRDRMCGVPPSLDPVRASYNTNPIRMLTFW